MGYSERLKTRLQDLRFEATDLETVELLEVLEELVDRDRFECHAQFSRQITDVALHASPDQKRMLLEVLEKVEGF